MSINCILLLLSLWLLGLLLLLWLMHPACDKYLQVLWPTHDLLILIISLSGETQVESWLDAFCHDFRCRSSVKWWVIKQDSGPDRETSSRAELLCRMQQAAGVCFLQKAAWWRFNPVTALKKRCFYWHWMEADRPLKHQTENVKKNKKKTKKRCELSFLEGSCSNWKLPKQFQEEKLWERTF